MRKNTALVKSDRWRRLLVVAPAVAAGLLLMRGTGLLQVWELSALDLCFRLRPVERADPRIVIVGIGEEDLQEVEQWPIPDAVLAELLVKVKMQQPRAIGLDIYRNLPVDPGSDKLKEVFLSTPNLIGIQKVVGDPHNGSIAPPPDLEKLGQVSANDFPWDADGKIRRAFLYLDDSERNIVFSLGFRLAQIYLEEEGISPRMKDDIHIELGKATFRPFTRHDGGYAGAEDEGYQMMINYRGPMGSFPVVSLTDVRSGNVPPGFMRDRIVIIGSVAKSLKDFLLVPYSISLVGIPEPMTGVEVHAHVTSQIISAALEGRPLLKTWPDALEWVWICIWAFVGGVMSFRRQQNDDLPTISLPQTAVRTAIAACFLSFCAYTAFLLTWWIPFVPPILALTSASIITTGYTLWENLKLSHKELENYARTLEFKVEERTRKLKQKNEQLIKALQKLKTAQKQIIAQEKLASLGSLAAGIAHEIRNPLNFVNNFAGISIELSEEIMAEMAVQGDKLDPDTLDYINEILVDLKDSVADIKNHGLRIETIVQGMLALTQNQQGEASAANLNALLEEALQLAYQGQRAKDGTFNITIKTTWDTSIGDCYLVPQDISRAFVNMINNACDALRAKRKSASEQFTPILAVQTRRLHPEEEYGTTRGVDGNGAVEIRIRDNGEGIALDILDKIYNPFFTTRPPGEGTGLGLSIAYDIIVGQHRGEIKVDTGVGTHTEFTIILPLRMDA
ncbi:MAG TPA: CHASE2 domain-containing protein [Oscillatoriaceae cyanobacterium M33_DOE_052]|uniref:histidine kinase n=1 Tax=Planktothricoides sp. SpSt-374 TaxID=2282167 RepID=A0A7C3VUJ7_9CYAN|nr:CHASE2 domain-containing protein [Oscillatoriaceae cyanobacterium M33_DOE_052]